MVKLDRCASHAFLRLALGFACLVACESRGAELTVGATVERYLHKGQPDFHKLQATAGQFIYVIADQRGIDLKLAIRGPDDNEIASSDRPNSNFGPEAVALIAPVSGTYTVVIDAADSTIPSGKYLLRLAVLREPLRADIEQMAAISTYFEARKIQAGNTAASRRSALELYGRTLRHAAAAGDTGLQALTLAGMGMLAAQSSEFRTALDYWTRAASIYQSLDDRHGYSLMLNNLGGAHDVLGDLETARKYYSEAFANFRESGDARAQAVALNNMGKLYSDMADWQKALDHYSQAVPLFQSVGDRREEANTLSNIGMAYNLLGTPEKGIAYFEQSLAIQRTIGHKAGEANTLSNMGLACAKLHQFGKAIDYYELALALQRERGDPRTQAVTYNYIGAAYAKLGQADKALENLRQAVALSHTAEDRRTEGIALGNMGYAYRISGRLNEAVEQYGQSISALQAVGDRGSSARMLEGIAWVERARGSPDQARKHIEAAIAMGEDVRATAGNQASRASYFASTQDAFEFYIDLLMEFHRSDPARRYDIEALQVSERARARSLLEMIAESRVDFREGVDPALLERERTLANLIGAKAERLMPFAGRNAAESRARELSQEISRLEAEYQQVQTAIRARSAIYAAITHPKPLNVSGIQTQVLDAGTVLLHYSLGKERSYLWAVTQSDVHAYELPKREQIETPVRELYALITARSVTTGTELPAQRRDRIARSDAQLPGLARKVSDMVLKPAQKELNGRRLAIVADGALQHLPFAMLPEPSGNADAKPLVAGHEIVELPSSSALAAMRTELANRPLAPKLVAVFADPVFDKADRRLKGNDHRGEKVVTAAADARWLGGNQQRSRILEHESEAVAGSSANTPGLVIPRLPFTRKEAERIVAMAPKGSSLQALDFRASIATVASPELGNYRYVHFATHGYVDTENPVLSSLVLSLVNEQGNPQQGFLRTNEIYNLKLPAELVVLSACQTGLGKQVRGEGLVGLTRAFMYAGAKRVVVSLWNVNDEATSELMSKFYFGMWKRGLSSSEALRQAQLAMSKQKQWGAPYYWAAFLQQGEWK